MYPFIIVMRVLPKSISAVEKLATIEQEEEQEHEQEVYYLDPNTNIIN